MYRLPAEWEPQEAIWLTWPQNKDTWQNLLPQVVQTYESIAQAILQYQDLHILVHSLELQREVEQKLQFYSQRSPHSLTIHIQPTNDCWIRDYGSVTVQNVSQNQSQMVSWGFNSWGGKYSPWDADNAIPYYMGDIHNHFVHNMENFVLEGGSIDSNGNGLLLTTTQCLLHPNRNPKYTQEEIESILKKNLGMEHLLWLHRGIAGDDTDGHVDDLARFVSPHKILCAVEENTWDPNYKILQENWEQLQMYKELYALEIIPLPMPSPIQLNGLRTPASYANFLIINNAVLLPVFQDPKDAQAIQTLQDCFPNRTIHPIDCRHLSFGQGGIHCISMQVPRLI
jgi:agmatine deiminase